MKKAFGAIDLLVGLVITAIVFMIGMNALRGSSLKLQGNNVDTKSVQQQVDERVNEIQNMRQQAIEYNKQVEE